MSLPFPDALAELRRVLNEQPARLSRIPMATAEDQVVDLLAAIEADAIEDERHLEAARTLIKLARDRIATRCGHLKLHEGTQPFEMMEPLRIGLNLAHAYGQAAKTLRWPDRTPKVAVVVDPKPRKKSSGRPPGSKNKPKPFRPGG